MEHLQKNRGDFASPSSNQLEATATVMYDPMGLWSQNIQETKSGRETGTNFDVGLNEQRVIANDLVPLHNDSQIEPITIPGCAYITVRRRRP